MAIPKKACTREIIKIAENNVLVRYFVIIDGKKYYIDNYEESYGQERIERELQEKQFLITTLSNMKIADEIAKVQDDISMLNLIHTENHKKMAKEIK